MSYFPLMVQLEDAPVLLVGGGRTAFHKAKILVDFGARVQVVAPELLSEFRELPVRWESRTFEPEDLDRGDWILTVAATNHREVNRTVSRLCREKRIPVNVVDDPELCSFIFPALIREGEVVCAVSSGGRSPLVAQYVKKRSDRPCRKDWGPSMKNGELPPAAEGGGTGSPGPEPKAPGTVPEAAGRAAPLTAIKNLSKWKNIFQKYLHYFESLL